MKKKYSAKTIVKIGLIVLAVLLVVAGICVWHMYSQVAPAFTEGEAGTLQQTVDPEINIETGGQRFYNLLLVGIDFDADDDGRDYANGKGNTDVIMYLQINRDTGDVNVFQIPRDTYYGLDMGGGVKPIKGKLNEVYANGPDQENLINNLANKIYDLFKLPIDDYVTIDMQAFKTMLNNMGGIEMYVPWDIITVDEKTGTEDIVCLQGTHQVSGDTAELILRNRNYATADYKRLETQQYFYAALVKSLLNDYSLADYYSTCKVIAHYINTSLDITEIWGLFATMLKVEPENIYIVRAGGGAANIEGYKQVYYVDIESCTRILNENFRNPENPVGQDKLGLAIGYTYLYGMNVDEGRSIGSVMGKASEGEAQLQTQGAG